MGEIIPFPVWIIPFPVSIIPFPVLKPILDSLVIWRMSESVSDLGFRMINLPRS